MNIKTRNGISSFFQFGGVEESRTPVQIKIINNLSTSLVYSKASR